MKAKFLKLDNQYHLTVEEDNTLIHYEALEENNFKNLQERLEGYLDTKINVSNVEFAKNEFTIFFKRSKSLKNKS